MSGRYIEDLPSTLGAHCSVSSCRTSDFLPFTCPYCSSIFCKDHATPATHECSKAPDNVIAKGEGARFEDKFADLLPDPNRLVGERTATEQAREDKSATAKAVLAKNFGAEAVAKMGAGAKGVGSSAKVSKPVSPVIALMKLKQRAKPVEHKSKDVAMDDRIYLTVEYRDGEVKKGEKDLFLAKTTTVGKALDLFAITFDASNVNHTSTDPAKLLVLATTTDPPAKLPTNEKLGSVLTNGGSVLLSRGSGLV